MCLSHQTEPLSTAQGLLLGLRFLQLSKPQTQANRRRDPRLQDGSGRNGPAGTWGLCPVALGLLRLPAPGPRGKACGENRPRAAATEASCGLDFDTGGLFVWMETEFTHTHLEARGVVALGTSPAWGSPRRARTPDRLHPGETPWASASSPSPGQPPICLLSLDLLFWTLPVQGVMQDVALGVWLLSPSRRFPRLIHTAGHSLPRTAAQCSTRAGGPTGVLCAGDLWPGSHVLLDLGVLLFAPRETLSPNVVQQFFPGLPGTAAERPVSSVKPQGPTFLARLGPRAPRAQRGPLLGCGARSCWDRSPGAPCSSSAGRGSPRRLPRAVTRD